MKNSQLSRRQVLKGAGAIGVLGAIGIPTTVFAGGTRVRWDIISVNFTPPASLSAGGKASAHANDGSMITLTGSGTFQGSGDDDAVTGGGMWWTFDPGATSASATGTYKVKRFVSWEPAPGSPPLPVDHIGDRSDESAGLAVLQIRYSDGKRGVLTLSCQLVGTSLAVFEGITATKGYVDYFDREDPMPGVDGNRTNFHILD